jgi:hypothetical protein
MSAQSKRGYGDTASYITTRLVALGGSSAL